MTDAEIIQLLKIKLRETLDENDRLRAELARMTEGASAYATLSDIQRNREVPAAIRTKAAIACLSREMAPLAPEKAPLDLVAEPPPIPLAELVTLRRARADAMLAERCEIRVLANGRVVELDDDGNGSDGDSSTD